MARKSVKTVPHRRRREGKTNYKNRLTHLLSKKPRLVIRPTTKNMVVQFSVYNPDGDITKVKVNSGVLEKFGWKFSKNNLPACYLAGFLAGKKALSSDVKEAIADLGMQNKSHGGKIYAALKGVIDAGVTIPHSEDCFPTEERLTGEHIKNHVSNVKEDSTQFSSYKKKKLEPEKISEAFENTKKKILES